MIVLLARLYIDVLLQKQPKEGKKCVVKWGGKNKHLARIHKNINKLQEEITAKDILV
jgi:hypothetical protein